MPETNTPKTIDVRKDFVMWELMSNLRRGLSIICTYMQQVTPYGDAYIAAFEKYKELNDHLDEFEGLLQDCVEDEPEGHR